MKLGVVLAAAIVSLAFGLLLGWALGRASGMADISVSQAAGADARAGTLQASPAHVASVALPVDVPSVPVASVALPAEASAPIASSAHVAERVCERFLAEGRAIEARAFAGRDGCGHLDGRIAREVTRCMGAPQGVVGLRVEAVVPEDLGGPCPGRAQIALVHVDERGVERTALPGTAADGSGEGGVVHANYATLNGWKWGVLGEPSFFDFNGDGDLEVVLAGVPPDTGADEWRGSVWREVWTYRAGNWQPYDVPQLDEAVAVEDVDGDGRPDLWTRGPYASIQDLTGSSEPAEPILPAMFVLHSTNGGTFAGDDGVARAVVASLCPRGATLDHALATPELSGAEARAIVCARVRGATEADVQKALAVRCTQFVSVAAEETRDHCPSWTKELAAIKPPIVLL